MGSNVYDFENHMVAAGGVSLVYDGDGNRVKETVTGVTTSYLVADQNLTSYAQVMDELQGGAVSRTYSYGLSLISQKLTANGQGLSFYGFDGHGSVRFLTSPTGAVTDTYDYDAFGKLIASTGITPNNYRFAGEQFDPALGIYYNRARYYDQRQGRFWSMDGAEGSIEDPISLHKYLYASANPIDLTDPSGYESLANVEVATGINAGLQGIALVNVLKSLGFVASALLTGVGLASFTDVLRASRANAEELRKKRKEAEEEAQRNRRNPDSKLLFHYTTQESAEAIFASGQLLGFEGRGGFPFGAYATDIAGWLVESLMRRSQLTTLIFGRNTGANYAQTIWFVAFEQDPQYPFKKVAPFIYVSARKITPIFPVYVGPNLLGE